ncbi:NAD(+) synthase [Flavobacterium chuncheonense]|uniref:NH(3)-dependent NAD(+) synthetase n=1 Tax=Flavobacterium chuncheonense TaxID=2026653 RepID=A0ABW5YL66_9FLAO
MTNSNTFKSEEINQHIVQWLLDYANNAKVKGFVVGISGGIDSALTSTLCAQTGLATLCVEMPIHQHQSHVNRAVEHITQLKNRFPNVSDIRTDLTPVFDAFTNQVEQNNDRNTLDITLANTRARLRMTTLYYHAGIRGLLVAGTGNKVEDFGVGFYTKYGDGGVDISPIADLVKSEVRLLAKHLDVPESILNAAPSDGLYENDLTDEMQIGASYDELELAMQQFEAGKTENDFVGREAQVFKIYKRLNTINQHKMNPIPVCEIPKNLK